MPRDFDISPYFAIVKPTIEIGFNYRKLRWANLPLPPQEERVQAPRPLPVAGRGTPAVGSRARSKSGKTLPRRHGRSPESVLDISANGS